MDSDIGALYIESLNQVMDVHASRLAIGVRMRFPWASGSCSTA